MRSLQLGEISTVVVFSPKCAKEVMKTHDVAFANWPNAGKIEVREVLKGKKGVLIVTLNQYHSVICIRPMNLFLWPKLAHE